MTGRAIREIDGDLFTADDRYALCHSFSSDFKMGRGIAVIFREMFGRVLKRKHKGEGLGKVAVEKINTRFIYHLITKKKYWNKPTYQFLNWSLREMRAHMLQNGVRHIAMPRISCGYDGLQWPDVKTLLAEVFEDDAIEIVVYNDVPKL